MTHAVQGKSLVNRVTKYTPPAVNRKIMMQTERSLLYYAQYPEEIDGRLDTLKNEWDIEQTLETNASFLALLGLFMAVVLRRRWLILVPFIVLSFLLQQAIQGWCPPVSIFRRLGVRTSEEIQLELYGLRMLGGDFNDAPDINRMSAGDRVRRVIDCLSG